MQETSSCSVFEETQNKMANCRKPNLKKESNQVVISSVWSSNSHPDLLVTHNHFFRPHWSSTLDFHFLSHYSFIKDNAI